MKEYKTTIVIPAGRKKYMELLIPQILNQKDSWDELQIWKNTTIHEDIEYLHSLTTLNDNIKVIEPTIVGQGIMGIFQFFKNCIDPNTVYIRFDDDVVYIEPNLIKNLAEKRWNDKHSFLVSPLVINNAVHTAIMQKNGVCTHLPQVQFICMDDVGWKDPIFAENLHRWFLDNGHNEVKILNEVFETDSRYSINCISWLGSKFKEFDGNVGHDEEQWLSEDYIRANNLKNKIYTEFCCSHFSYFTQKAHLDSTDILSLYRNFVISQGVKI